VDALDLARWQFAITTVYHFLFVPLTIGLAPIVAVLQTLAYRTGEERWLRATKFFGKLFLINFAMGVVTGIVQEFQFGMNWSSYSRYVGDIFGAPLAIEGLLAFFLESTFLGLWIFGWGKLPRAVHLACIWLAAAGTWISAYFILAANSWMHHPVGYRINELSGRAELTDFVAVLLSPHVQLQFQHTILASLVTAAAFVLGVSAWHLLRRREVTLFRGTALIALSTLFAMSVMLSFSGHAQAQFKAETQPMKIAASEALWETESPAGWSIFAVGDVRNGRNHINVVVPNLLSILSTNTWDGEVQGMNPLQAELEAEHGPGDYIPAVGVLYWAFRIMVGAGGVLILFSLAGLVLLYRRRLVDSPRYLMLALPVIGLPFLANSAGWIFTEMGRQPWVVYGLLRTADGVSPSVGVGTVALSLAAFTVIYSVLAVVEVGLLLHFIRQGPTSEATPEDIGKALAY
jgi:cytochrome bd ubiquinol oxidase subunit I